MAISNIDAKIRDSDAVNIKIKKQFAYIDILLVTSAAHNSEVKSDSQISSEIKKNFLKSVTRLRLKISNSNVRVYQKNIDCNISTIYICINDTNCR